MAVLSADDCAMSRALGRLIRRVDKTMTAIVESSFEDHELSFLQWIGLKRIADGVVRNAGELARELDITTGATTRFIDVLESRGLIHRSRSISDRRVITLTVTEGGRAAILELTPRVADIWNHVIEDFEQADLDRLIKVMRELLSAVERAASHQGHQGRFLPASA